MSRDDERMATLRREKEALSDVGDRHKGETNNLAAPPEIVELSERGRRTFGRIMAGNYSPA